MLVTAEELAESALGLSRQDAERALADIDQDAIHDEERARLKVEAWDFESDINGAPAEQVLAVRDDVGDRVLLIRDADSGRVVVFQPLDEDDDADAFVEDMVSRNARARIVQEAVSQQDTS